MRKQLIIIGAGGHAHDIVDIYHHHLQTGECDLLGCLDDNIFKLDTPAEILGRISEYTKFMSRYGSELRYIVAINSSAMRAKIVEYLDSIHARPATLIHRDASIARTATIDEGCVFGPTAVVTSNAKIGRHVHLNTGASVNHGSVIGDFCTLSPGARVCGDVKMGERVQMGANSTVINLKSVGDDSIIGAGAVVICDVPYGVTAKGVPAKW